jgi:putative peptide zinc metalloprotease protein
MSGAAAINGAMSGATANPSAVSALQVRPRLKPHVDQHRHVYRNEVWYVFHDRALDRFYRISGRAADLVGALDGTRTLPEIEQDFRSRRPDAQLDGQHVNDFVVQMNALGLLRTGQVPEADAVERKADLLARRRLMALVRSPLAIRVPLFDPSWMLEKLAPLGTALFSRASFVVWSLLVFSGVVLGLLHWGDLRASFSDQLLSIENIGLLSLIYPAIKALHELGHGVALRRFGAEVHRMGVIFIAFMPVPYVDASSSVVLRSKRQRMLVAGAGIMTELAIASLAMIGWLNSAPSLFHSVCYNVLLISGLSTILFNGNPLQRYDGYFLLCDLAEIPNLGMRAASHVGYLTRRYLLADAAARPPRATPAERRWFVFYGLLSSIYRTWLVLSIAFFVARAYPLIGGAMALWSAGGVVWGPAAGLVKLARRKPGNGRSRAMLRLLLLAAALGVLLFAVPLPHRLVAEGVVWLPDEANVRGTVGGEVAQLLVAQNQPVVAGQPVLLLSDARTEARLARDRASLNELLAGRDQLAARGMDPRGLDSRAANSRVGTGKLEDRIVQARAMLAEAETDKAALLVRSPASGSILFADPLNLPGRFLPKGQAPAVIWNGAAAIVRVLVPLSDIDDLRHVAPQVLVRPGYDSGSVLRGHVLRVVPAASEFLPSAVLAVEGGGHVAVTGDARDARPADAALDVAPQAPLRMAEPMFEVDIACDDAMPISFLNGRATVRFDLGWEALGPRIIRAVRLVFLRDLHA